MVEIEVEVEVVRSRVEGRGVEVLALM